MQEKSGHFAHAAGWLLFVLKFVAAHLNETLSVACGVAALIAWIYSILIKRKQLKLLNSKDPAAVSKALKTDDSE